MFKNDEKTNAYLDCFFEKLREFGFEHNEIVIMLMNAADKTDLDKILKAIDYIEPAGTGCVRRDVSKKVVRKEIERILVEGK